MSDWHGIWYTFRFIVAKMNDDEQPTNDRVLSTMLILLWECIVFSYWCWCRVIACSVSCCLVVVLCTLLSIQCILHWEASWRRCCCCRHFRSEHTQWNKWCAYCAWSQLTTIINTITPSHRLDVSSIYAHAHTLMAPSLHQHTCTQLSLTLPHWAPIRASNYYNICCNI